MREKDFAGAKRMIIKAQQLSKDVDSNISQMLTVCDIHCASATKPFVALDLNEQAVPSGANQRSAGVWKNSGAPSNFPDTKRGADGNKGGTAGGLKDKRKFAQATGNSSKASSVTGLKRGRRATVESSESSASETSTDSDEEIIEDGPAANNVGPGQHPRRSSRQKQEVKYNEESDDDDTDYHGNGDDGFGSVGVGERQHATCADIGTATRTTKAENNEHNARSAVEEIRSLQKFQPGQIWALYSDVDKFPNYYAFIKKVDLMNHELQARPTGRRNEYEIVPRLGEIWAVFKNWRTGWTAQDYKKCDYELVEIFGHTDSSIQVQLLRKVVDYRAVFMPDKREGAVKTIRKDEYPKFSHQIPCFHLTNERGGKLRGFLELDPLSVPEMFLFTDSI
ncbi:hypothetical protein E2562_019867 [Oryza meyeriana var. granulata]|uniref:DUF3444 domain-containing protein n=1 Tax=Oryza meyeriana var. granulata TaxID=110450 RepID=A0A6G1CS34_9ORYZ|nr:hypothetical protein E2562_019867 [Oryza meyeriana var. granulata]